VHAVSSISSNRRLAIVRRLLHAAGSSTEEDVADGVKQYSCHGNDGLQLGFVARLQLSTLKPGCILSSERPSFRDPDSVSTSPSYCELKAFPSLDPSSLAPCAMLLCRNAGYTNFDPDLDRSLGAPRHFLKKTPRSKIPKRQDVNRKSFRTGI
jgi:hypothetical protein